MMEKLKQIEDRNSKVEADKAWETSKTRKGLIAFVTYLVAVAVMYLIGANDPWFGAFVPVVGFLLSTLTLGFCKNLWLKKIYRK